MMYYQVRDLSLSCYKTQHYFYMMYTKAFILGIVHVSYHTDLSTFQASFPMLGHRNLITWPNSSTCMAFPMKDKIYVLFTSVIFLLANWFRKELWSFWFNKIILPRTVLRKSAGFFLHVVWLRWRRPPCRTRIATNLLSYVNQVQHIFLYDFVHTKMGLNEPDPQNGAI